jgi:hypothetical protein
MIEHLHRRVLIFQDTFVRLSAKIKAKISMTSMMGGPIMADSHASSNHKPHPIAHNPLEFERTILEAKTHTAAQAAGLTSLSDSLEDASKIIAGLGALCKLGRNNQDLASGASEEDLPLSLTMMECLFSLGEVAARRFISEIES